MFSSAPSQTFEGHDASVLKVIFVSRGTQVLSRYNSLGRAALLTRLVSKMVDILARQAGEVECISAALLTNPICLLFSSFSPFFLPFFFHLFFFLLFFPSHPQQPGFLTPVPTAMDSVPFLIVFYFIIRSILRKLKYIKHFLKSNPFSALRKMVIKWQYCSKI